MPSQTPSTDDLGAVRLSAVLMLWAVALAARFIVGSHIVDDAYITMRYSRHLAALHLISYNPPTPCLDEHASLDVAAGSRGGMGVSLPRRQFCSPPSPI